METINFDGIPLFRELGRIDRARLIPHFTEVAFAAGDLIIRQGDPGDCLYIIIEGSALVRIRKADGQTMDVATLGSGECMGEIALLTGQQRTADVEALTPLRTLRLSRDRFHDLMRQYHFLAVEVAGIVADRLRLQNEVKQACGHPSPPKVSVPESEAGKVLPTSSGLKAGWSTRLSLRNRRFISAGLAAGACLLSYAFLSAHGVSGKFLVLFELLLAATLIWSFDAFSYHAVALALPLAAVMLGIAAPETAFSGFSNPSWFLVLGVFAMSAAVSKTGLMYRCVLKVVSWFPPRYRSQSLALAVAGLLLTPVIPSSNGRAVLAGPIVANISEILHFQRGSAGSVGLSMAALLGFGHMSFLFMNGTATCLLALGLLPREVSSRVTWGSWHLSALPLGLTFFVLSYLAVVLLYRPEKASHNKQSMLHAQLSALGPMDIHERITLVTVCLSLAAFITQPLHHIIGAWVALFSFFILFSFGVLNEKSVRSDIDWNFLISFGAIIGFGNIMSTSGFGTVIASQTAPLLQRLSGNIYLFLISVSLGVHLLRFVLPLPAAQLISILSVVPMLPPLGIDPFVVCLVVLISGNPWFFPFQNSIYLNLIEATEGKLFHHHHTLRSAIAHVVIVQAAIIISIPYWRYIGLIT